MAIAASKQISELKPKGWQAQLSLRFANNGNKTVLADRSQSGPLTVQRAFYPEGDVCHLYLLHPPGGVVGGDELHINVNVEESGHALITTPGATKFYRNEAKLAQQIQTLKVENDSCLEWFPQENIFFNNTNTQLVTRVELEESSAFMGWEINCYGRPASNELFEKGLVKIKLEVYREGKPLVLDTLVVNDSDDIDSPSCLAGYPCFGTFIATHVTKQQLQEARDLIETLDSETADNTKIGLTLIDDVLIARCLGQYAEQVTTSLKLIWKVVRPESISKQACYPRIWST